MIEWPKNIDPDACCSGAVWDGEYEKQHYLVTTASGERVVCWPNAGKMSACDASGRQWIPEDRIGVIPLDDLVALRLLTRCVGG